MSEPLWKDGPIKLLEDLRGLIADRAPAEVRILGEFAARNDKIEKRYARAKDKLRTRTQDEEKQAQDEFDTAEATLQERYETERAAIDRQFEETRQHVAERLAVEEETAEQEQLEAKWHATALFEGAKNTITEQVHQVHSRIDAEFHEFDLIQQQAERLMRRRWQWRRFPDPEPQLPPFDGDPVRLFTDTLKLSRQRFDALAGQFFGRLFEGVRPLVVWLLCALGSVYSCGQMLGWWRWYYWAPASVGCGLAATLLLYVWLYGIVRMSSGRAYLALRQILAGADLARRKTLDAVLANGERQTNIEAERRRIEWKKADDAQLATVTRLKRQADEELQVAEKKHAKRLADLTARRDQVLAKARAQLERREKEIRDGQAALAERMRQRYTRLMSESEKLFDRSWQEMAGRWTSGMEHFQAGLDEVRQACQRAFPAWDSVNWSQWKPPAATPPAVPFATADVQLARLKGGLPKDGRLVPAQTGFQVPAALNFRDRSLLLLKADGEGRVRAVDTLQAFMLRLLVSLPPGKVRFMIIDPVGLGKNFSAFMHLADFNEQLVSNRIWTDTPHIEQRLQELTVHMEDVIQVYLRNEFPSIEEYNAFAGDLAEPYRVLVVANFPVGFSDAAVHRLSSIIASGARCGVYTLLAVDTKLRMPREFHLDDLAPHAVSAQWKEERFVWEFPGLGNLPLTLDEPPPAEQFTEIVRVAGRLIKDATRVEVPFESVAPPDDKWWTTDSRSIIDVPLGHSGATKFQNLQLGKGTSQHVLVAGKTGSGKSTLWHALITNLALRFSPDEIEMYLVDFKKGVEFKAYAQSNLPHARVIAIESEREFGLSVLERLDQELKRRGDLFRALGVQDVAAYRNAQPQVRMPRVLLIVDEFQELFVEDDRIAQNASLLLDRLVRQGRAFGMHVLLGSQTLAGSYSLPRSTIGQMAVRIALQCSESDAHLILSEENTAARLLTRPGEAIYNDANGLFEGNHPFQIVWLNDDKKDRYLHAINDFAKQRNYRGIPPIVFEGNAAADLTRNPLLHELLTAPVWPDKVLAPKAWMGAAVAIKDPTEAELFRQGGANLLIVGHQEETALGILVSSIISLAAQFPPAGMFEGQQGASFYVLDGTRPDSPLAGQFEHLARYLPHPTKIASPRGTGPLLASLAQELAHREESGHDGFPPIYLVVYDLGRFRDLRKTDDDFSFARSDDDKASPASQFVKILREGPAMGIHVLVWCDTYNNVNRVLDRQGLRDLELRVLFQMNTNDSSNLIDSPAASQLGMHRALMYDEGQGRLEKFRPFGLPSDEWLAWMQQQFQARATDAVGKS